MLAAAHFRTATSRCPNNTCKLMKISQLRSIIQVIYLLHIKWIHISYNPSAALQLRHSQLPGYFHLFTLVPIQDRLCFVSDSPISPSSQLCFSSVCRTCPVSLKERVMYGTYTRHVRNMYETSAKQVRGKPGPGVTVG